MIKKYSKIVAIFFLVFFFKISPSFAREMTKEELAEYINATNPDASYVYIEGKYVFTSSHKFTREDSMLASLSIELEENDGEIAGKPIYDKMTIYRYTFDMNEDFEQDVNSFKWDANMTGKSPEPTVFNIKYVDYEYVPELADAELKEADENAYNEIKKDLGIDFRNDSKIVTKINDKNKRNISLEGVISPNNTVDTTIFPKEDLTGFYYAFVVDGLTDSSVVTVEGTKVKTFTSKDFTNGRLVVLMALHPGLDNYGRNIRVTVDADGPGDVYGDTVYNINYQDLVFEGATTRLLTEDDELYSKAEVKDFLTKMKYDFTKTAGLKLENGKLTGKILYNGEVGSEFSSLPEDITGYYFTYVLKIDGDLSENSKITIPGNGGRKEVLYSEFDSPETNEIVIPMAINPLKENKVIDIIVDLDGDGNKYAPVTYTIDYSGVEFEKISVSKVEDLMTVIDNKNIDNVVLTDNITSENAIVLNRDITIDLNGKTLNARLNIADGANVKINNGKVAPTKGTGIVVGEKGKTSTATLVLTDVEVVSASNVGVYQYGGQVEFVSGKVEAQESAFVVRDAGKLVITDGEFTAHDNSIVATNGSKGSGKNSITIDGGTFTGTIQTPNYIANGIYVANDDEVVVNGGTFNITNGTGILIRSGKAIISDKVVINVTQTEGVESGYIGDSKVAVPNGKEIVIDGKANYPGGEPSIENSSEYEVTVLE